ncbi:MAG: hypothetical protein MJE68_33260 [Proteobacteria bacterium]|nr:hypothetical protein [Pseudomonadota bacterium]
MGQKTGMLKKEKNVQNRAISVARVSDNLQRWKHAGMREVRRERGREEREREGGRGTGWCCSPKFELG